MATTPSDVASYVACTLMSGLLSPAAAKTDSIIRRCLDYLKDNEFVISTKTTTTGGEGQSVVTTDTYILSLVTLVLLAVVKYLHVSFVSCHAWRISCCDWWLGIVCLY